MKRKQRQESLGIKVSRFIQECELVSSQHPLLVAVSGGPDSVCLLHILITLQKELGMKLHVAHLNHQLRGAEADADAQYVANLANKLGVPATVEKREVRSHQALHRLSLEEAAREVRYNFLAEVAWSIGSAQVATGHTLDDHAETILMHLIRGAGIGGLRGLLPEVTWQFSGHNLMVIRPFLQVTKEETTDYCQQHQLEFRVDASNLSLSQLRNRTRLELLPLLKSYNPRITEALLRTAFIAEGDATYLENEVSSVWNEIVQERKGFISLNKEKLLALHPTLQRYLLRTSLRKLLGSLKNIEALHVEDIVSALSKPAGKKLNLPAGLVFSVEYDRYLLAQDIESSCPYPVLEGETPLRVSGDTLLPGWRVIATIRDALQVRCQRGSKSPVIGREQMADVPDNFIAYFDFDRTGKYLSVRTRRRGDRFHPMGMSEAKKLGEFMINAKIPRDWRSNIPIISSPSQILWIVGWRIDDRVKITEGTQKVLCLKMERR